MAELDLENRRGQLIPIADAIRQVEGMVMLVRTRLLAMPNKLAPRLATVTSPAVAFEEIRVEVYAALTEIASDRFKEEMRVHINQERKRAGKVKRNPSRQGKPKRARAPVITHRTKVQAQRHRAV